MTRDRIAAFAGGSAGLLGIAAGLIAAAWGTRLGTWAGAKQDPVPLGLLTTALSVLALAVSADLYRADPGPQPARRAAITTGQLLPGLLGFTTVGPLWWIPGTVLILASIVTVSPAPKAVVQAVWHRWPAVLTSALGACLVLSTATADPPLLTLAAVSGALVATSPWTAAKPRWLAPAMLAAGALPFAALTWWTLIIPFTAALSLTTGLTALHQRRSA